MIAVAEAGYPESGTGLGHGRKMEGRWAVWCPQRQQAGAGLGVQLAQFADHLGVIGFLAKGVRLYLEMADGMREAQLLETHQQEGK